MRILSIFTLFLMLAIQVPAQISLNEQRFDQLSIREGLSQSSVNSILHDSRGYIWFSTQDGLNRYDGYTFVHYKHDPFDSTSISENFITALAEDQKGNIWIGTQNGLNRLNRNTSKFSRYYPKGKEKIKEGPNIVKKLFIDQSGKLWLATGSGLMYFDTETDRIKPVTKNEFMTDIQVSCVFEYPKGILWLAAPNDLIRFDVRDESTETIPLGKEKYKVHVTSIKLGKADELWLSTYGYGMIRFNIRDRSLKKYLIADAEKNEGNRNIFTSFDFDESGSIWVATLLDGLYTLDTLSEKWVQYKPQNDNAWSMNSKSLSIIYTDNFGNRWIGTNDAGVFSYSVSRNKFIHISSANLQDGSRNKLNIFALRAGKDGVIWCGSFGNGAYSFDRKNNIWKNYTIGKNGISHNSVKDILISQDGDVWIGTNYGLNRINTKTGKIKQLFFKKDDPTSITSNHIASMYEDKDGYIWLGTGNGLNKLDPKTEKVVAVWKKFSSNKEVEEDYIAEIYGDDLGFLWLGTFTGLVKFDPAKNTFKTYVHDPSDLNSLRSDMIFSVLRDKKSRVWVGTNQGLSLLDEKTGKFTHYTEKEGLPNNYIYGLLEDESGLIWMSSNAGLTRFNVATNEIRTYTEADGLQGDEFNGNAYFKTTDGEMLFGGLNGFNAFYPTHIKDNKQVGPVLLTGFKKYDEAVQFGKPLSDLKEINLKYNDNFISFEFAALDFISTANIRYAYKLEGVDADWIYSGNRRFATYTNLDPGEYFFTVKATNPDGIWGTEQLRVKVVISPPFWKTTWFLILSILFVTGIVYLIYTMRVKAKVERIMELEKLKAVEKEKVREKTANDFHDEMGHRLTRITMLSELVKRKLNGHGENAELTDIINTISENSNSLYHGTKDFIWSLDPKNDSLYLLAIRLKDFGDDLFDRSSIDFQFVGIQEEFKLVTLSMDWRRHIALIFKEAMHNALKHADCKNVILQFQLNSDQLEISITDDGKGFDPLLSSKGNGLVNMSNRAKKLGAELNLVTEGDSGTCIIFTAKLKQTV